jgi:transcriptional regulator with XRE-family HTH domain
VIILFQGGIDMGDFQNIFKQLRLSSGYTQIEMSQKLGISRSTIGMYETGAREPDFETLEIIADFFNVDTDYLLGRTNKTTLLPESAYYFNEDARELAEFMFKNPEYKVLFDASRKVKKEDIEFVRQFMDRMRGDVDDTGC